MSTPRILILYNDPVLAADHPDSESEREVLDTVQFVDKALADGGFATGRLGISYDPERLLHEIKAHRPDAVFNLYEGTADDGRTEAYMAGLLEWLNIPFTGCPSQALCLAHNKHLTKPLLRGMGLPTPDFLAVESLPAPKSSLRWPVIVKLAAQDASVGLDQGSVVTDQHHLEQRLQRLLNEYGPPILIEEFIAGRELNVGVIECPDLKTLPISEILFKQVTPDYWPIVTYDAKWNPGSIDYEATPPLYPAEITPELTEKLVAMAKLAFKTLGCRDYARVDFRVLPSGEPFILEINPNPDFSPTAGLAGGLASAGISHAQFTVDLVKSALARAQKRIRQ